MNYLLYSTYCWVTLGDEIPVEFSVAARNSQYCFHVGVVSEIDMVCSRSGRCS